MEKIKVFLKSTLGKRVILVLVVVIAFILGMEYKEYQIRTAIKDAFSDITGTKSEQKEKTIDLKVSNDLTKKVALEVLEKGFDKGTYEDYLTFTFKFTNNSGKEIQGVKGNVTFLDIFGESVEFFSVSYDKGILVGESKLYYAILDYNQFDDSKIKLRNTDLAKLKYEWRVSSIVYTDGTVEKI